MLVANHKSEDVFVATHVRFRPLAPPCRGGWRSLGAPEARAAEAAGARTARFSELGAFLSRFFFGWEGLVRV